jgi:hypothetical protein
MMEKTIMNLDNGIPIEDEMIRMLLLILIRQLLMNILLERFIPIMKLVLLPH